VSTSILSIRPEGETVPSTNNIRVSFRVPKPVRNTLEEAAALSGATLNQTGREAAWKIGHHDPIGMTLVASDSGYRKEFSIPLR
jgi:hypothetical protein